jgi:hypothetical protein
MLLGHEVRYLPPPLLAPSHLYILVSKGIADTSPGEETPEADTLGEKNKQTWSYTLSAA